MYGTRLHGSVSVRPCTAGHRGRPISVTPQGSAWGGCQGVNRFLIAPRPGQLGRLDRTVTTAHWQQRDDSSDGASPRGRPVRSGRLVRTTEVPVVAWCEVPEISPEVSAAPAFSALLQGGEIFINTRAPDGTYTQHSADVFVQMTKQPERVFLVDVASLLEALGLQSGSRIKLLCADGKTLVAEAAAPVPEPAGTEADAEAEASTPQQLPMASPLPASASKGSVASRVILEVADEGVPIQILARHENHSDAFYVSKATATALGAELLTDPKRGAHVFSDSGTGQPVGRPMALLRRQSGKWYLLGGIHDWMKWDDVDAKVGDFLQLGRATLGAPAGAATADGTLAAAAAPPVRVITVRVIRAGDASSTDPAGDTA